MSMFSTPTWDVDEKSEGLSNEISSKNQVSAGIKRNKATEKPRNTSKSGIKIKNSVSKPCIMKNVLQKVKRGLNITSHSQKLNGQSSQSSSDTPNAPLSIGRSNTNEVLEKQFLKKSKIISSQTASERKRIKLKEKRQEKIKEKKMLAKLLKAQHKSSEKVRGNQTDSSDMKTEHIESGLPDLKKPCESVGAKARAERRKEKSKQKRKLAIHLMKQKKLQSSGKVEGDQGGSTTLKLQQNEGALVAPQLIDQISKKKLKMKEFFAKKKAAKRAELAKKLELEKTAPSESTNEEKTKMKKKRRKAKPNEKRATGSLDDGEGISNPSFETSFSIAASSENSEGNQQLNGKKKKRKRNRKKKKSESTDSVDGNNRTSNNDIYGTALSSVPKSESSAKVSNKRKMIIAKLLQEAESNDRTLTDLKQKRSFDDTDVSEISTHSKKKKHTPCSLREKLSDQLKSARFRWLNEQFYTSSSWEAMKYFQEDPEAYEAYHSGYQNQVAQWPLNPVEVIVKSIASLTEETVVADFGCGAARLAESLPNYKVHSLDLVASKPGIIACDMAHSPLLMESVDVAVFCLSLMGTNLNDFILEANRVLKTGGMLKIAEVESRFEDIDNFTSAMVHFGFQLKKKDLSNQMFIFMDFQKVRHASKTGKMPVLTLDPCVYKKR